MADERPGPDPVDDARMKSLDRRLREAHHDDAERRGGGKSLESDSGYRLGNRVLAELLGGMLGGALMGWLIDRLFGTAPWGLLVMLSLGIVVAFRQIIRLTTKKP
jgi:ATP synthase protein I